MGVTLIHASQYGRHGGDWRAAFPNGYGRLVPFAKLSIRHPIF